MHAPICPGRLRDPIVGHGSFLSFVLSLMNPVKDRAPVTVARQNDTMRLKIYFTRGCPVQKFVRYATNDIYLGMGPSIVRAAPSRRRWASGRYYERRKGIESRRDAFRALQVHSSRGRIDSLHAKREDREIGRDR